MATDMSSITSSLTGGVIDTASIVQQLMQVESRPLTTLQQKEAAYQSKITAMGQLLSSVSTLQSAVSALKDTSLLGYSASVSDSSMISASATTGASAGSHNIQIKQLASTQSIYSTTFASSSDSVADLTGAGASSVQKLKIETAAGSTEITIDASNNTLSGIRDAINAAKINVNAFIVNDGTGNRLVLNSSLTGTANRIKISVAEDVVNYTDMGADIDNSGLSRLAFNPTYNTDGSIASGTANMTQSQAAVDAVFKVDGLEITKSSNVISDVLPGVTFSLTKADNYASNVTLAVGNDSSSLKSKIQTMVNAYNALYSQIKTLRGTADSKGTLSGESVLLSLSSSIRGITSTTFANNQLAGLGVSLDKAGVMSFDSTKLDTALASDSTSVVATLNAMGSSVSNTLNAYVNDILPSRQKGLQTTVKNIQKSEERMQTQLTQIEDRLKKQYTALDTLLQQLQNTSSYVTTQMNLLNKQFSSSSS
jgi:flagellar hook-associated protein 2